MKFAYLMYSVSGKQAAVGFGVENVIQQALANPGRSLVIDATFRVVPRQFQQLLVVFLETNGTVLPAFFVLMERKTRCLYEAVFAEISRRIPAPASVMSDWETALRRAAAVIWPAAQQRGCWFHYSKAVLRQVGNSCGLKCSYDCKFNFILSHHYSWICRIYSCMYLCEQRVIDENYPYLFFVDKFTGDQ